MDVQSEDELDPMVIVCQGPPACLLEGDAAMQAQIDGCIWCRRIIVHQDGTETVTEPGHG
jgi:hypothetical protein